MSKILKKISLIVLLVSLSGLLGSAFAQGSVTWNNWQFDWGIGTDSSGIVLQNVRHNGKKILDKASFPVVRVEYDNDVCGPYADILSSGTFRAGTISANDPGTPSAECNGQRVCQRTFFQDGEEKLELGGNSQIGEYQMYQVYYFGEDTIETRMYSRGLQCRVDHSHHSHWLFDFDIGDSSNDQVLVNGTSLRTTEFNDVRGASQTWDIKDTRTGDSVTVVSSADDGVRDSFSNTDVAVRAYNSAEVGRWTGGARGEIGNRFNNGENINGADIVFWYVSHMRHLSSEGDNLWHSSGPTIRVNTGTTPPPPDPDPDPDPPTTGNLLQNPSFDTSSSWLNCGNSSSFTISGGNLNLSNGGCVYQTVAATPGTTYSLSCNGRRVGSSFNSMTLSMLNSSWSPITQDSVSNTNTSFAALNASLQAPAGTTYAAVTFYSEGTANYSNCSLVTSGTPPPDPDPDPPPPPPTGDNSLVNGGFDGTAGWLNCGNSASYSISGSRLNVNTGACVYQTIAATPGTSYSLACSGSNTGSAWNSVTLSMLNSSFQAISQDIKNITPSNGNTSSSLTAPSNAAYVGVTFYSEGAANYSGCTLSVGSSPPPNPDPPTSGNLLQNASFDTQGGWNNCADPNNFSISGGNLNLSTGACVFQTAPATAGGSYTLSCNGNTTSPVWSTLILSALDSNWQSISQNFTPITTSATTQSVSLTTPSNTAYVAVSFYTEGNATYRNCSLVRN